MKLTCGSLFSGIGGMDLGLERAGFQIKWFVEKDEYCKKVLAKHWPDVRQHGDVHSWPAGKVESVDLIAGGDPCQENSNARQNTGLTQSSLGAEFIRIVDALRPRLVLRENPSSVRRDAPWPWWRFRDALERLGYNVLPFRLRACCLGAHHQRERLFLLAELADAMRPRLERDEFKVMAGAAKERGLRHLARQDRRRPTPRISGSRDGLPNRPQRIKALGNAVYPDCAEWIGKRIMESLNHH